MSDGSIFESEFYQNIMNGVPAEDKMKFLDRLPVEPGMYLDQDGLRWILSEDMRWMDHEGHSEDPKYNWVLGINPANVWTRVEDNND